MKKSTKLLSLVGAFAFALGSLSLSACTSSGNTGDDQNGSEPETTASHLVCTRIDTYDENGALTGYCKARFKDEKTILENRTVFLDVYSPSGDLIEGSSETYRYDENWRLVEKVSVIPATTNTYDYEYYENGAIKSETLTNSNEIFEYVTKYSFDENGLLVKYYSQKDSPVYQTSTIRIEVNYSYTFDGKGKVATLTASDVEGTPLITVDATVYDDGTWSVPDISFNNQADGAIEAIVEEGSYNKYDETNTKIESLRLKKLSTYTFDEYGNVLQLAEKSIPMNMVFKTTTYSYTEIK